MIENSDKAQKAIEIYNEIMKLDNDEFKQLNELHKNNPSNKLIAQLINIMNDNKLKYLS